jgi:uncharacterized protein (TIGR02145 family)
MKKLFYLIILLFFSSCEKEPKLTLNVCKDGDGNIYKVVTIGTQTWTAENMKTTTYNDGTFITENRDIWNLPNPFYCHVLNDAGNSEILYNWYVVNTGKLCPIGWHVPTDAEFKVLEMFIGITQKDVDTTGWRGTNDEADKLKATHGWAGNYNTGIDLYGFAAVGTGYRFYNGNFEHIGEQTSFWTSTENTQANYPSAWIREINWGKGINRGYTFKTNGFSVRCIKN